MLVEIMACYTVGIFLRHSEVDVGGQVDFCVMLCIVNFSGWPLPRQHRLSDFSSRLLE